MNIHRISVEPVDSGWLVRSDALDGLLPFLSGAKAEEAARRLGERLGKSGDYAEIRVRLRDGSLGGRFVCVPETAAGSILGAAA